MNETLTPKQYKVLEIIKKHIAMTKDSPTVEELRCALGCNSQRTVSQYLESLERKGFIFRRKNMHRNIELRPAGSDNMPVAMTVSIPVVASVGCDDLSVFAQESYDEYLEVDKEIAEKEDNNLVAVRAIGDSMVDAGIQSGDYLLIRFTEHAENGDRVAAIIDDSIVVKRYEKKDNMVILWPESKDPKYKPIVLRGNFKIVGRVLCVISKPAAEQTEFVPEEEW